MTKTFYSYSFGCRINEAEKEQIDRQMIKSGYRYEANRPDIYIINTCSVTHKAEREARQLIYQIKRKLPATKIVVTGCSATYWKKNKLYTNLPVTEIIDNTQKDFLVELLKKRLSTKTNTTNQANPFVHSKFIDSERLLVKIQDGCQRYCSFCIVPYLRGKPKSTKIEDLRLKIKEYENEIKEVILTAINTEAFGFDTGEGFVDLVQTIIDKTNIPRISFGSIHPWSIDSAFFDLYRKVLPQERLVNFFHIPVQSGSNKILNLMKRGYTREEIMDKLQTIHTINPTALIGTDIIVGYLDESDRDFDETYEFLRTSPISRFHVFRYSKRLNTAAYYLSKRLREPQSIVKEKRAKALAELNKLKYDRFVSSLIGQTFDTLFLRRRENGFQEGLLSNQVPINVQSSTDNCGQIKKIKVTGYKNSRLFGKIV